MLGARGVQLHARAPRDLRGGGKGGWRGFPKKPFGGSLTEPATVPEIFRSLLENRAFDLQLARKMLVRGALRQPKCSRRRRVWGTELGLTDAGHQLTRLTRRQRPQGLNSVALRQLLAPPHARSSGAARGHRLRLRRSPPPCSERRSDPHDWLSVSALSTSQFRARAAALLLALSPVRFAICLSPRRRRGFVKARSPHPRCLMHSP